MGCRTSTPLRLRNHPHRPWDLTTSIFAFDTLSRPGAGLPHRHAPPDGGYHRRQRGRALRRAKSPHLSPSWRLSRPWRRRSSRRRAAPRHLQGKLDQTAAAFEFMWTIALSQGDKETLGSWTHRSLRGRGGAVLSQNRWPLRVQISAGRWRMHPINQEPGCSWPDSLDAIQRHQPFR